jgi:osmotically inducible protein OsmC
MFFSLVFFGPGGRPPGLLHERSECIPPWEIAMPQRTANAVWEGDLKSGKGKMRLGSGAWEGPYSFASRFENGTGTNPKRVQTRATVHLEKAEDGFRISRIDLQTEAEVPGIDPHQFQEQAESAKKNCPVSKALAGVNIQLQAKLV